MRNESEVRAYQLIFKAIEPGSKVEVTDDKVLIYSDSLSAEKLEQLLIEPARFKSAVQKYEAVSVGNGISAGIDLQKTLISRTKMPELPHDFLKALFDDEILTELGWNNIDSDELKEADGNIIYMIKNYTATKKVWDGRISMLEDTLKSVEDVKKALSSGTKLHLRARQSLDSDITKNIDDIVGIKVDKHSGSAIFYLNQRGLLMNTDFAPKITINEQSKAMELDKGQFVSYMGKYLSKVTFPKQDLQYDSNGVNFVRSVLIPQITNAIKQQHIIMLLIDTSSSLLHVEKEYKEALKGLAENIITNIRDNSKEYPNSDDSIIRLVPFNNDFQQLDFPINEVLADSGPLIEAIMSAKIAGNTLLYGTLKAQIESLKTLCRDETSNVTVV